MNFAVLQFPASNCDQDALHALRDVLGHSARYVWHKETSVGDADAVIVPGGFFQPNLALLPPGFVPNKSPFGVTFSGPAFSEPKLIGFAYAYEQASHCRITPDQNDSLATVSCP